MWALPCDVYDLEPRSCYENEEPVLACRETVSWGGNCQNLLTSGGNTQPTWVAKLFREAEMWYSPHQILRIAPDTFHSIRTEGEALVLIISIPPLDAFDQHVATEHREAQPR
jgi:hypothetical protein